MIFEIIYVGGEWGLVLSVLCRAERLVLRVVEVSSRFAEVVATCTERPNSASPRVAEVVGSRELGFSSCSELFHKSNINPIGVLYIGELTAK